MKQVTIPAQWLQELIALCGPEDHELRERVMKSAAPAPVDALATGGQAQAVEHATQLSGEPVAYLDIGSGGYLDIGTDLNEEQLSKLPKGRHMLVIGGTHGVDGYAAAPIQAQDVPTPWLLYLSDRADGVAGHYAIARWNPAGYREVWNLRSHRWSSFSDDVLNLEQAQELLKQLTIPTAPQAQADARDAALSKSLLALESCKSGTYTDVDGDTCRSYRFDRTAVADAIAAIAAAKGE